MPIPAQQRDSILSLVRAHAKPSSDVDVLPHLPSTYHVTVSERAIDLEEIVQASKEGKILEAFGTGTAAVFCPVQR